MASEQGIRSLWQSLAASGVRQPDGWQPAVAVRVWMLGLHALSDDDLVRWLQRWSSATPTDDRDRERRRWWPIPVDIVADCRPGPSRADVVSTADADLVYLRQRWTLGASDVDADEGEALARMLPVDGQPDRGRVTTTQTRTTVTTRDGREVTAWQTVRAYGTPTVDDVVRHQRIREVVRRMGGLRAVATAMRSTEDGALAGLGHSYRAAATAEAAQQMRALGDQGPPALTDREAAALQSELAHRLAHRRG